MSNGKNSSNDSQQITKATPVIYLLTIGSCADWKRKGWTSSGYYTIDPDGPNMGVDPTRVYCDMNYYGDTGKTSNLTECSLHVISLVR